MNLPHHQRNADCGSTIDIHIHGVESLPLELQLLKVEHGISAEEKDALGNFHHDFRIDRRHDGAPVLIHDPDLKIVLSFLALAEDHPERHRTMRMRRRERGRHDGVEGSEHAELSLIVGGGVAKGRYLKIHGRIIGPPPRLREPFRLQEARLKRAASSWPRAHFFPQNTVPPRDHALYYPRETMKVLVIGGAGYIGSHCVRQLLLAGHEPVVLDSLVFGHRGALGDDIKFYQGDLGDPSLLAEIFSTEKIDIVMHFAAFAYVGESVTDPLKYYDNNVARPVVLLRTMKEFGIRKFVFSSTCATYGIPDRLPITESLPQRPINPYGQTKLDVENLLKAMAVAHGLSFAAFRYFNAAGAAEDGTIGEDHHPETHLIPLVIDAATGRRDHITVFGRDYETKDGTCLRDYVHVDDLSRAHIAAFDKLAAPGLQLFCNLGTGMPYSVREVIHAVEDVTGRPVPVEYGERRPGDPPALFADSSKAKAELNWQVQFTDIRQIVQTAWAWHESHPRGYDDRGALEARA